jgi:hypothetical protein
MDYTLIVSINNPINQLPPKPAQLFGDGSVRCCAAVANAKTKSITVHPAVNPSFK